MLHDVFPLKKKMLYEILIMHINLYFQFDEPHYDGYHPNWHELFEYKLWKHPNEDFCRKDEKIQSSRVEIVLAYPIILVCALCKLSKKYVHLNHSTFMFHFWEKHQEKLQEAKVAKCPICLMWFNNIIGNPNPNNRQRRVLFSLKAQLHHQVLEQLWHILDKHEFNLPENPKHILTTQGPLLKSMFLRNMLPGDIVHMVVNSVEPYLAAIKICQQKMHTSVIKHKKNI